MEENVSPREAQDALGGYLDALDAALPGFAEGVYLTGSAALGDWIPGRSDLDVLVVSARPAGEKEIGLLREVHEGRGRPFVDTVYVGRDQVGLRPYEGFAGVPVVVDGVLKSDHWELNPVLWATLARHGVTVRGPEAGGLGAEPDPLWLRGWNLGNLTSYWTPLAADLREKLKEREPDSTVQAEICVWCASGPGRLHKTIATGRIISKSECVRYTAGLLAGYGPEYADHGEVLARAGTARAGNDAVEFTAADLGRLVDLVDAVAEDAARL
ncbi:MAG TPA: nucleotidyltransferase domain-containing protein [Actinocrinis sp.]|nr:nucleotidyltransferase domain-containing protein [Actinocrinis sp.]